MEDIENWLRDRPYYDSQLVATRTLPGRTGSTRPLTGDDDVLAALEANGISRVYRHQADAVEAIRNGDNVVMATPTASGKSLAYTIPALERAHQGEGWTLYIGPQVALINDQAATLGSFAENLPFGSPVGVAQYTGQVPAEHRSEIREHQPTILLSTPDMVHYGMLPHANRLWDWFFKRLSLVVLDEVHEYRGVFGSHVGLVMRRLHRLADRFGADPQYVCCSATIGNPIEHSATVTGQSGDSFELIASDMSPTGPTHWKFWNPPTYATEATGEGRRRSNHVETMRLFVDLVERGHQTVAFTRARQTAERYALESQRELRNRGESELANRVAAYQAALPDTTRSDIETALHDGDMRGVWSTNALELGVDIGGLDVILLDGYPGTRMAARQQAGRAGRGTEASLVVLIAGEDQLDQFFMQHPAEFFDGDPERAVANPGNDRILPAHVASAARESWITPRDKRFFPESFPAVVSELTEKGDLERRTTDSGVRWTYAGEGSPQHEMNLRRISDRQVVLRSQESGDRIGTLPFEDALRDVHPGAIYHHQGETYEVTELDLEANVAELTTTWADYYTSVLHDKRISVDRRDRERPLSARDDVSVWFGSMTVSKRITGYERRDGKSGKPMGRVPLSLPETALETEGLFFTVPSPLESTLRSAEGDFEGAIHAAEHGMIGMFPVDLLCDRRDIGGLSTPFHPATGKSTIFLYDGYPGGIGLTERGFDRIDTHLQRTERMISGCGCADGCPACVQSPHCGNANEPLDKSLAVDLLRALIEPESDRAPSTDPKESA